MYRSSDELCEKVQNPILDNDNTPLKEIKCEHSATPKNEVPMMKLTMSNITNDCIEKADIEKMEVSWKKNFDREIVPGKNILFLLYVKNAALSFQQLKL